MELLLFRRRRGIVYWAYAMGHCREHATVAFVQQLFDGLKKRATFQCNAA